MLSTLLSILFRCFLAALLWVGIGIVALVVSFFGGQSAGKAIMFLWYASSAIVLVWAFFPFFSGKGAAESQKEARLQDHRD